MGLAREITEITEHPYDPSRVAAFMSAHSKTPYITPSMDVSSGKGVVWGGRGPAAGICLALGEWLPNPACTRLSKGHNRAPPRPQWGRSIHVSPQYNSIYYP